MFLVIFFWLFLLFILILVYIGSGNEYDVMGWEVLFYFNVMMLVMDLKVMVFYCDMKLVSVYLDLLYILKGDFIVINLICDFELV